LLTHFKEVNGNRWVGYNLAVSGQYSETVCKRLKNMAGKALYGSMDINVPFDAEEIVFMLVSIDKNPPPVGYTDSPL
jgi:hypothetical protein